MTGASPHQDFSTPTLVPLGDSAVLVRFGMVLTENANRAAIALALALQEDPIPQVVEVMPNLVSVLLRYDPLVSQAEAVMGEVRLRLFALGIEPASPRQWAIPTRFDGPDIGEVAQLVGMTVEDFVAAHCSAPLRVLATGFAPGFVYCGMHGQNLVLPRRTIVRPAISAGSVLFAAGQTAITATEMPTGWHVIGHTSFRNFDPTRMPPTQLSAGDEIRFEVLP